MHKSMRKSKLIAAVMSVVGAQIANAANFVWSGSAAPDTSWSNVNNWTNLAAPSASSDTITFDNTGTAALANTVDAGLATTTFSKITYSQTDSTQIFTTTIGSGVTLSLLPIATGNSPAPANASLLVMPATGATASASTGTVVKIVGGAGSKLSYVGGGSFAIAVTGRPLGAAVANESFAVLDMSGLDQFVVRTDQGAGSFTNCNFGVGVGNVATGDRGAWSGKVILANNSQIDINRISVGGQHDAGTSQNTPNSLLVLGASNTFETIVPGTIYVGSDPSLAPRDPSGGVFFRADLVNPTLATGLLVNAPNIPNLQVGSARNSGQNGSHNAFGVFDATSASGGADGSWGGAFGNIRIGDGYNVASTTTPSTGGGHGMMSMDKGQLDVGSVILASTRAAGSAGVTDGQMNVGLKGKAADAGAGTINVSGNVFIGQRNFQSNGTTNGILNIANNGAVNADRVFLADNTSADFVGGVNSTVGILNLGGGTLTTGQIQAGSDTAQLGTRNTRLVNFNGGTLKVKTATAKAATFMQGLTAANVYAGGGTIDTNGQAVTINQPLVAPAGDGVSSVSVSFGGTGYRVAPIVVITPAVGDTGIGATAVAQIDTTGTVTGITVTNPGTGYTAAPTINLIANAGTSSLGITTPFGGSAATVAPILASNANSGGITKVGAGSLTFNGSNTYTGPTNVKAGNLIIGAAGALASTNVTVDSGATLDVNGNLTGAPNLNANGTVNLAGNATMSPLIRSLGNVAIGSGGAVNLAPSVSAQFPSVNIMTGLSFADATAKLDVSNNKVFVPATKAALKANIVSGSIVTSAAGLSVGYSETAGSGEIRGVYAGDANLDTMVNSDDFQLVAMNFNESGKFWQDGDFNYDGLVNALDFNAIATHYGAALPAPATAVGALVPEPASIAFVLMSGVTLLGRRRK